MAQSVELVFEPAADDVLRGEWRALADAGLPSAERAQPDANHRPHITLYAADQIPAAAESELSALMAGLDLEVQVGALMVFGPRRGRCILVRHVVADQSLLRLQGAVAEMCGTRPGDSFGPGRWTPHVTLARRMTPQQVGQAIEVLGEQVLPARIRHCRRWDGERRTAWWLTD